MILPITDFLLAADTSADRIPEWLIVVICVVIFFIAGFAGGVISYNAKLKKLRENKEDTTDSNDPNRNLKEQKYDKSSFF